MRLTLAVLLASLTIYCSGPVLSLPPSLFENAASLRQPARSTTTMSRNQQQQPELVADEDAAAASSLNALWKKDTRYLIDTNTGAVRAADSFDSGARHIQSLLQPTNSNSNLNNYNSNNNNNNNNYKVTSAMAAKAAHGRGVGGGGLDLNRKLAAEYDLNALLAAAATSSAAADDEMNAVQSAELLFPSPQEIAPRLRELETSSSEFFTPLKYWARHCQQSNNCPQEYYRSLLAGGRDKAVSPMQMQEFSLTNEDLQPDEELSYSADVADNIRTGDGVAPSLADDYVNSDIFTMVTGEQDLMKFLHWAMEQLYPYQKFANTSGDNGNGAEYYYPDMFLWKKLNLSGRLEPSMVVEEPHYVIVRREQLLPDDMESGGSNYHDDPFIPPRGRKHHLPDLDALLQRYETFVPNRGKRDKIKDIFKYDDLFFPNRGKKQRAPNKTTATTNREIKSAEDDPELRDMQAAVAVATETAENDDENALVDNLTAPPTSAAHAASRTAMRRIFEKLKKKFLQQQRQKSYWQHVAGNKNNQAYEFNDNNELPQRMSTHKINGYDRSVKSSMPAAAATATITGEMSSPAAAAVAAATINAMQQLRHTRFISTRPRRLAAGSFAGAARVAANRLHSTRSMSTMPQQQQQHRRLSAPVSSSSSLSSSSRYRRREQQKQQKPITIPLLPSSSSSAAAPATTMSEEQQQQVKSLTNLDPLLWRQLQLLQQKALTMRHAQLSPRQHLPQQHQQQHQPRETQLDVAAVENSVETDVDDDIDYFYFNI